MVNRVTSPGKDLGGIWHPGELELQRSINANEKMAEIGKRDVRNYMPEQHREFYAQLPFIIIGTIDEQGDPWCGVRYGEPGFITSPNPKQLHISGIGIADDPMEAGLKDSASIGLLGIELHTRRRNRMNGLVKSLTNNSVEVEVDQSFGNCPQYIQLRQVATAVRIPEPVEIMTEIDVLARTHIKEADTFFVSTYADRPDGRQVDVSHRGGGSGFIAIGENGVLTIPDFAGNHFFATLGNILLNKRAGLTFINFVDGTILQMTGKAEILPADDNKIEAYKGAERFWCFCPERIMRRQFALPMCFSFEGWSPNSLTTGNWELGTDVRISRH